MVICMTFEIKYFDIAGEHLTLRTDGCIEVWYQHSEEPVLIRYPQARMLKRMIIAEYELDKDK